MANKNDDDFKFDPIPFMVGAHIGYQHEYKKQQRRMREQERREQGYDGHDGDSSVGGLFSGLASIVLVGWILIKVFQFIF